MQALSAVEISSRGDKTALLSLFEKLFSSGGILLGSYLADWLCLVSRGTNLYCRAVAKFCLNNGVFSTPSPSQSSSYMLWQATPTLRAIAFDP